MSGSGRQTRSKVVPPGASVMNFGGTKSRPLKQVIVMPPAANAPHKPAPVQLNIAGRTSRPPYLDMVKMAITSHKLHMIHGVSYQAIGTYILQNFPTNAQNFKRMLRVTCSRAVSNGQLEKTGNKYKITRTEYEKDKQRAQRAVARSKGSAGGKTRPVRSAAAKKRPTRAATTAGRSSSTSSSAAATQTSTKRKRAASASASAPKPAAKKAAARSSNNTAAKRGAARGAKQQQGQGQEAPQLQRVRSGTFKENEVVGNNMKWSWQYYDNGWFNYDPNASDVVETNYQDYLKNPGHSDVRAVHSGMWNYMVDFRQMMQQNIQHENHTRRKIRRVQLPIAEINNRNRYADSMDDSSSSSGSGSSSDSE